MTVSLSEHVSGHARDLSSLLLAVARAARLLHDKLPTLELHSIGRGAGGELQTPVDVRANELFRDALAHEMGVATLLSEETKEVVRVGEGGLHVAYDPLDGSTNLLANAAVGSIFGFYDAPFPAPGSRLQAAAYAIYGPTLTYAYTVGRSVFEFMARSDRDDYVLVHEIQALPEPPGVYAIGGARHEWPPALRALERTLGERGLKLRYSGCFIVDVNQVLHYGGFFGYPATRARPHGGLRLLYEANPASFLMEAVGGLGTDGHRHIRDVQPSGLHARTPVFLGNRALVQSVTAKNE